MFQGHTEIAKKLINAGCKINELIYVINSEMFNDAEIFCISECLDGGLLWPHSPDNHEGEQGNIQRKIVSKWKKCFNDNRFQLLLEKKCELDLCDEINGNTPIMLATSLNQLETVKRLIKEGADINLVRKTSMERRKNTRIHIFPGWLEQQDSPPLRRL